MTHRVEAILPVVETHRAEEILRAVVTPLVEKELLFLTGQKAVQAVLTQI